MLGLLLAAVIARGLRPKEALDQAEGEKIPGVSTHRSRGGGRNRWFKKELAKLRAMPDYKSKAERNRAKARRRALRAAGIVAS